MGSSNGHSEQPRDISFERAFTLAAGSAAQVSASQLITLAERRAPETPILGFALGRDFGLEGMEEAADWRNYLCWQAMQIDRAGRHDGLSRVARGMLSRALAHVIVGFEQHRQARELLVPIDTRRAS